MNPISLDDKHLIIREAFRHYIDLYDYWKREGKSTITYKGITISILDMKRILSEVDLSDRKAQAFYLNVLEDKKQKDVAEKMGITTVSVGQYVNAACRQYADLYMTDEEKAITEDEFLPKGVRKLCIHMDCPNERIADPVSVWGSPMHAVCVEHHKLESCHICADL
jgi:predicted DNA-binding protein (UPF0251 family)